MALIAFDAGNPTPVGSSIFSASALLIISLLVLLLLRHFLPLRSTPAYLSVPVFFALALPASIVLLVPIDVASSFEEDSAPKGIWLPKRVILVAWRIAYWLTFVLTWFILPLLGEYIDSGYRDPRARITYSLRSNARYQLIVLCCGLAGLIYISIQNGFDFTTIKALIMALAYVWGLILAIYLMGHGLVAIPRKLYRNAFPSNRLRWIQSRATGIHDRLSDAIFQLEDLESQVTQLQRRKTGTARDFQEWIEELGDMVSVPESRMNTLHAAGESTSSVPNVITERYLADLTRRLHRARHQRARFVDSWDRLVREAAYTQAIVNSSASQRLERDQSRSSMWARLSFLTPYMRYHLYSHALPALRIFLAALFAFASACIVWSELIKFFAPELSVISLTVVHHVDSTVLIGFGGQVISAAWISYMCSAALFGVMDAKVWGNRALVRRNTYGESACWYAGQIARLTVPLAYNFLTFLPWDLQGRTVFYHFLGRLIDITPLGKGFDYFFPIFILFPVCATLFNLYGRVKRTFGFELQEEDDDTPGSGSAYGINGWREGRDLIDRELNGLGSLGLSSRGGSPSRGAVGPTRGPTSWASSADNSRQSRQNLRTGAATSRGGGSGPDEEEAEENFFQLFGRRVKNTFETTDRPDWLRGSPSFTLPRWMTGDEGTNNEGPGPWTNLFGGRQAGGHVRL